MFYEEKVIDGILHFRTTPDSNFQACTKPRLTTKIIELEQEKQRNTEGLKKIRIHFADYQWEKIQQVTTGLV